MARRASSSIHPASLVAIGAGLLVLGIAAYFLLGRDASPMSDAETFPAIAFQEDGGRMYAGNEFLLTGTLENRHIEGDREIAIIGVKTQVGKKFIPVSIPSEVKSINIERNSEYDCLVVVDQDGLPIVREIRNH